MTTKKNQPAIAMAFYHGDGFTAAWQQAITYAGNDGRVATMPDIIQARLKSKPGTANSPWEKYYTTLSAEYLGLDKNGRKVIIVAHGVGPMATLDGIQKAYSWEYKDKKNNRRGGRITQQEFWDLADGKFGPVSIVDLEEYRSRYRYPLIQILRSRQAASDPLLQARFGPQCEEYVKYHTEIARAWHRTEIGIQADNKYELSKPSQVNDSRWDYEQKLHYLYGAENSNPYIIEVRDGGSDCNYFYSKIEKGFAFAHLLSTGGLSHVSHNRFDRSLVLDVACHDWTDGTRLVGIQKSDNQDVKIFDGPDPHQLLRRHWNKLWQEETNKIDLPFCALVDFAGEKFTQYQKIGARMDTKEPKYLVSSAEKIGDPVLFRTTVGGYHAFFRYDIKEVKMMAPPEANAYEFITSPEVEYTDGSPSHHTAMLQFYKIEADTKQRLIRVEKLARDYELLMKFM